MKRQRGRGRKPGGGGGGGNHGNHGNRPFESSGPEVKIRGTAAQIYEKYAQYARDAQSGGDRVKYENYLQHAEHYYRVMAATMPRERLLAQQEGGFGQAQGEGGQEGQGGEGQGNFGQPQHGGMGGNPGMNQGGQNERGDNADPMKVMDDQSGPEDDGDYDNEGDDQGGEGEREEVRAAGNDEQGGAQGDRNGRRRRRGRRGRHPDGPNDGPNNGGGNTGGGGGGGSALDSLARKQGALAGG